MKLRQIRYFVTLADTRNFHRAAERLNMSQPPLTVAIRKLEAELGAKLFERGPRGVALTAAGQASLDIAHAMLAQADRFRVAVRDGATGERGRLRVGFVGSATFELLPRIIPAYRRMCPLVELELEESTSVEIARALASGRLDVGFLRLPLMESTAIDVQSVDKDEMRVALPDGNRFAHADTIALEALIDEPFILQSRISVLHSTVLAACHEAGFVPYVAQEATQLSAVLALVRSGLGVALVPSQVESLLPRGVQLVRLTRSVPIETGVALSRDSVSPLARNFVAVAIDS